MGLFVSSHGMKYILVTDDFLTKKVEAIAFPNMKERVLQHS